MENKPRRRDRRIADLDTLNRELAAWQSATNAEQRQVDWQFTTHNARIKLRHLYHSIRRDGLLASLVKRVSAGKRAAVEACEVAGVDL